MRPENLDTKIFLDSGDPDKTREMKDLLGFLDGQTTNPTLISQNPEAEKRLEEGDKFTEEEIYDFYQDVVEEISGIIPEGSVSIEVYADQDTPMEKMYNQSKEMFGWIDNAHIKFPSTEKGLNAAERAINEGMRVNMTLCFKQEQAAAVHGATQEAEKGDVFVSPFIGRLDDEGQNGMDLITNTLRMYSKADSHVEVLAASIRNMEHFMACLALGVDIITSPYEILKEWGEKGMPMPGDDFHYGRPDEEDLAPIPYKDLDLSQDWQEFDLDHYKTDEGMKSFSEDWNELIE
ncbi:MAG: transaldolase family protein [Candidatus Magasanikbacteria bacterium]